MTKMPQCGNLGVVMCHIDGRGTIMYISNSMNSFNLLDLWIEYEACYISKCDDDI